MSAFSFLDFSKASLKTLKFSLISCCLALATVLSGQSPTVGSTVGEPAIAIQGRVIDAEDQALPFANVVVYSAADSVIVKVEVTDDAGDFKVVNLAPGRYFLQIKYVGLPDYEVSAFDLGFGESRKLAALKMSNASQELEAAVVTARRAIVEIKSDRTIFNVEGTINSAGGDGMSLLRKAPGVVVDNNDNLIVMGRSGVLIYIDGKRSPLAGEALTAYLRSIPAEQIDRIDIITNPGAKYEAEGNAGIIDIKLKKNETWGTNGSVSTTASQGQRLKSNISSTINHRQGKWNTFATGGIYQGTNPNTNYFRREQNGIYINEDQAANWSWKGGNLKLGTDYKFKDKHSVGVLVNGNYNANDGSQTSLARFSQLSNRSEIDSILRATSFSQSDRINLSSNLNYRYDDGAGQSLNIDLDYGLYRNDVDDRLFNQFFDPSGVDARTKADFAFEKPSDIDIYTGTIDFERPVLGGKLGVGGKLTKVVSDNTFRFFRMVGAERSFNAQGSNVFTYDEQVEAGYVNYNHEFGPSSPAGQGQAFGINTGLRAEHTRAIGDLATFTGEASTTPVDRSYWNFFPNVGLTWASAPKHQWALSYGRRINRPDYNNLNPFLGFASLVTFEQGNPTLRPEIVNNLELAHTYAYRYTTKLSYSRTEDQITRLIRPDDRDKRATYITWDNLANQEVLSLNVSIPAQIKKWWEIYFSGTGSYTNNQAVYPDGSRVDLQAFNFNMYAQNTFNLPKKIQLELSGWFSGPGIWGGTFETRAQGAVNLGVQRKFLQDKLKVRLAADDLFFTSGWRGQSSFAGQFFVGGGNWDSRRASLSLSYNFGNQKVKVRQRQTGLDDAAKRIGE